MYWSPRTPVEFAGRTWGTAPIIDIGTVVTAEIKQFRLYWKVDNILNRNNAYLPGYEMPGIIFRWGFSWTIA